MSKRRFPMVLTVVEAERRVLAVWSAGSLLTFTLVLAETVSGHFGTTPTAGCEWLLRIVGVVLAFLLWKIAVRTDERACRRDVYYLCLTLSTGLLLAMPASRIAESFLEFSPARFLSLSYLLFAPAEALLIYLLLYLPAEDHTSHRPPTQDGPKPSKPKASVRENAGAETRQRRSPKSSLDPSGASMPSVFFSYSHADERLRDQLEKQLALLKRQGVIEVWHDRRIGAGQEFAAAIDHHVETDDIILLLVSADFLASDYCYEKEMMRAMERHEAGDAIVIPVILRACDWHGAPFGKLNATPHDGKPITQFADRDEAMLEVARAVRAAAERRSGGVAPKPMARAASPVAPAPKAAGPRSSNLRLAKQFSDRDKDAFRIEGFEYLTKYFENSIGELAKRNPGIEATFRKLDANRFTAKAYRNGRTSAQCTIFMSGEAISNGIAYIAKETSETNSYNEMLTVDADDQALFFRSMGMAIRRGDTNEKLSPEGAAEFYWSMFIEPLQSAR